MLYAADFDPETVTAQTLDVDSDCESSQDLDYTNKNHEEFIAKAREKFIGTKAKKTVTTRTCLQETIANAFLDNTSAERFAAFFIITRKYIAGVKWVYHSI